MDAEAYEDRYEWEQAMAVADPNPVPDITTTGHIVGRTYYSTYWRLRYTVEGHGTGAYGDPFGVVTRWEDGKTTAHSTARGNDPLADPFD